MLVKIWDMSDTNLKKCQNNYMMKSFIKKC